MADVVVPEDPDKPGYDLLIGEIGTRTHYIHNAMAAAANPLSPSEIGQRAELLARAGGYDVKANTFSGTTTSSHLISMRDKPGRGFAELVGDGRWQLTQRARQRIAAFSTSVNSLSSKKKTDFCLPDEVAESEVLVEGAVRTILVNAYERNPEARQRCIAVHGTTCCICSFAFGKVYGPEAEGYIHVHHLKQLSKIGGEYVVDPVSDLRPVCPNCHAVLHLGGGCRSIDEVKKMLKAKKG